jgi:plastocyanin
MIMKQDFVRCAVFGGLLGALAAVAVMAAPAGAQDMAVKIKNSNFAPQRITVKAGTTVAWTNADDIPHAVTSTTKASKSKALDTEYDSGVICDTQKQAERLAKLLDGNEHTAIAMVNAEERDPRACAVETVAFVRGASLATARSTADTFAVVEVLVVGVDLGSGFQSIAPAAYFMLIKIDERNA